MFLVLQVLASVPGLLSGLLELLNPLIPFPWQLCCLCEFVQLCILVKGRLCFLLQIYLCHLQSRPSLQYKEGLETKHRERYPSLWDSLSIRMWLGQRLRYELALLERLVSLDDV
ncbi:hypothetical protein EMIT0P258_110076 [Pseudomonas sp. IT-P258]